MGIYELLEKIADHTFGRPLKFALNEVPAVAEAATKSDRHGLVLTQREQASRKIPYTMLRLWQESTGTAKYNLYSGLGIWKDLDKVDKATRLELSQDFNLTFTVYRRSQEGLDGALLKMHAHLGMDVIERANAG